MTETSHSSGPRDGYQSHFFDKLADVEDRHFWFRVRNRVVTSLALDLVRPLAPGFRVLEVGCGNGNVLRHLSRAIQNGTVIGLDLFEEGLRLARRRSSAFLVCGDAHSSPFRGCFDVIGVFDVIEHLRDDRQALRDIHSMLTDRGVLLLTVPAHVELVELFR